MRIYGYKIIKIFQAYRQFIKMIYIGNFYRKWRVPTESPAESISVETLSVETLSVETKHAWLSFTFR